VENLHIESDAVTGNHKSEVTSSMDAYRYFIEGHTAVFDLRHREGISRLRRAIELDSTFIDAYYWLAWQYRELGDVENARTTLKKGQKYVEDLSEDMKLEYFCNLASVESRWDDYAAHLQNLIELQPAEAVHHYRYGWVLCNKFRNFDNGIPELQTAVKLDSTNGMVYNELGYAFLAIGNKTQAEAMFEKYISLNPAGLNPLDSQADLYIQIGKYDEALQICDRVIARKTDFMPILLTKSNALLTKGRYTDALASVNKYLNLAAAPNGENSYLVSQGLMNKAKVLLQMQNFDAAINAGNSARALYPANVETIFIIAMAKLSSSATINLENELREMNQIVANDGNLDGRWFIYLLQSEIAWKNHQPEKAVELLQRAVALKPLQRNLFLNKLAEAHLRIGNTAKAVDVFQQVLSFNPNFAASALGLGRAYEKMDDTRQAVVHYQRVREILAEADETSDELRLANNGYAGLTLPGKEE